MNLPGHATLRNSAVKARQPAVATGSLCCAGLTPGNSRAPLPGAARGLDVAAQGRGHGAPVLGAREHLLGDEGFLGNSFLVMRALDVVGLVQGPHALEPGHLLGEEVAEAPPELHHPRRTDVEAARGTTQESPLRR